MNKYTCSNCYKKVNEVKNRFGKLYCYKCYAEKLENELFQMRIDLDNVRKNIYFYSFGNSNVWEILQKIGCELDKIFDKYLPTKNPQLTIKEKL